LKHFCGIATAIACLLFSSVGAGESQVSPADTATSPIPLTGPVAPAGGVADGAVAPVPFRWVSARPLPTITGAAGETARLSALLGRERPLGSLLRSPSLETSRPDQEAILTAGLLLPEVVSLWNSHLPFSFNEGAMWAGRGLNVSVLAGMQARLGPVTLILAPQLVHQENAAFQVIPFDQTQDPVRDPFSSPWHYRPASIDLPSRPGDGSSLALDPGQTSLTVRLGPAAAGWSTENHWWGPGIRNALVMSNHAPGFPHLFLRTDAPLRTRAGALEARWMLGSLAESNHYDDDPENDGRSISALALGFRPAWEPNLTLGFTRVVYAPKGPRALSAGAALDVFQRVGRPSAWDDALIVPGADQLFSLFAHWVFPAVGFEAYTEWGRYEEPESLRDFLEMPHHSQGYTLGAQWAREFSAGAIRLQGELTYLEPSASYRHRPVIGWYTSRRVEQGYTHRGQVIGAAIGPGASSQWLAVDLLRDGGAHLGLFGSRIRWDNAAFYQPTPRPFFAHDVSLLLGARGGGA
jgi:hypothetical protein